MKQWNLSTGLFYFIFDWFEVELFILFYFQVWLYFEVSEILIENLRCCWVLGFWLQVLRVWISCLSENSSCRIASQPKTKLKGGVGKDSEDTEQAKLRAGLDSVIIREKPNVKWSDVARLESAKQALQEAVILPVKFPQFFTG